jgi:two-component system response regulator AtoC
MAQARVLVVDDDAGVAMVLAGLLRQGGYEVVVASSAREGLELAASSQLDIVLTDLRMPGMDGMALLGALRQQAPDLPVMMLTAHGSIEAAVAAMRAGAVDFLTKPFRREDVLYSVQKALAAAAPLAGAPPRLELGGGLLGSSPAMVAVKDTIARAARSMATVFIRGESGTGKELAARSVHAQSKHAGGPFVAVNCAALPDQLLESELFGYEKGAFTGASQRKPGRVELADGGTLFLDEMGDVSAAVQAKLLRLLQEKEFEPLGATRTRKCTARFIAATHRDLEEMVASGAFREDLYYRLNVVPIWMPPLRERKDDLPELARGICAALARDNERPRLALAEGAVAALAAHDWPGNVRELANFIERLVVFSERDEISAAEVARELARSPRPRSRAPELDEARPSSPPEPESDDLAARRNQAERTAIHDALEKARGNRTKAARLLGISRRTLYKRLHSLGMLDGEPPP